MLTLTLSIGMAVHAFFGPPDEVESTTDRLGVLLGAATFFALSVAALAVAVSGLSDTPRKSHVPAAAATIAFGIPTIASFVAGLVMLARGNVATGFQAFGVAGLGYGFTYLFYQAARRRRVTS